MDTKPKLPRYHSWRSEQVYWAANALHAHNRAVNSSSIRALFDAAGVCTDDRGNQWIGDALGGCGLHLPKDSRGNYLLPPDGIEPELIVEWLLVDEPLPIDRDLQKFWPAAAALPPPDSKQTRKPKQPKQPSRDAQALNEMRATLCSALDALQGVVQLLREVPPSLAEAEAGLQLAEQLLESLFDTMAD